MKALIDKIYSSMHALPTIEGPIPVSAQSKPFCSMQNSRKPLNLDEYGYVEQEFFAEGKANVYEEADGALRIFQEGLPYKTRLIVRKPSDPARFSGRVYFDILNATQNYDIEDLWHRAYLWCMEHGHGYIGITSKPVNVQSLKNFDYARYQSLNWSSAEPVLQPAPYIDGEIPGTESGLIWDMIGQTATAMRRKDSNAFFDFQNVSYLCLTGQSQSGFYLNTFIAHFEPFMEDSHGQRLFDSYLNTVGAPFERELRQGISTSKLALRPRRNLKSRVPFIMISSEGDLTLFSRLNKSATPTCPLDSDTDENKCRYYEIAGSPHTDIDCPILSSDAEVLQTGRIPQPMNPDLRMEINSFPLAEYICGFLEKLYIWKSEGIAPLAAPRIERNARGELKRDAFSNVCGGFRTPYVDMPLASYQGYSDLPGGDIGGRINRLPEKVISEKFGSRQQMIRILEDALLVQQQNGWLTKSSVLRMIETAEHTL